MPCTASRYTVVFSVILQQCDPEKLITESKFLQLESLQELMKVREILGKGLDGCGTNMLCMTVDMCCVLT